MRSPRNLKEPEIPLSLNSFLSSPINLQELAVIPPQGIDRDSFIVDRMPRKHLPPSLPEPLQMRVIAPNHTPKLLHRLPEQPGKLQPSHTRRIVPSILLHQQPDPIRSNRERPPTTPSPFTNSISQRHQPRRGSPRRRARKQTTFLLVNRSPQQSLSNNDRALRNPPFHPLTLDLPTKHTPRLKRT